MAYDAIFIFFLEVKFIIIYYSLTQQLNNEIFKNLFLDVFLVLCTSFILEQKNTIIIILPLIHEYKLISTCVLYTVTCVKSYVKMF